MMKRLQLSLMFVLSAALLAACGSTGGPAGQSTPPSPSDPTPVGPIDSRTPHPLNVTVTPDNARTQTASVGPSGGTLSATAADGTVYTLTVPENALLSSHNLRMTPITDIQNLPLTGGFVGAVHLEPEGLQFLEPLTLTIKSPKTIDASKLRGFNSHTLGQEFYLQPSSVDGQVVTLMITHFSNPGAAVATDADLTSLIAPLIPTDPVDREENDEAVVSLLPDFSRIRPALTAATQSDKQLNLALRLFNSFRTEVRGLNTAAQAKYQKDVSEGWTLIAQGIDASVGRASTSCAAGHLDDVTQILRWVTWVKRNPRLAPYFNGRLNAYEAKVAGCASFKVELESTYTVRHYRKDEQDLIRGDWTTTHHVSGVVDLTYSLDSSSLDGPDGLVTEDGYHASGYENKSYDDPAHPLPPDCDISGSTTQPGPFVVGSNDTARSELDLDSIVAPLIPNTTTASLNLAMQAAPLEQFVATCQTTGTTSQAMPLWTTVFGQLRGGSAASLWTFNNIHLTNGAAEIDLPDQYNGPVVFPDGSVSDSDMITVSGVSKITVRHTPKS